jgi:hypothetical protein
MRVEKGSKEEESASKFISNYAILFSNRTSRHRQETENQETRKNKIA